MVGIVKDIDKLATPFPIEHTKSDFKLLQGGEGMEILLQIKSVKFTDTEKVNIQTDQGFMSAWDAELGKELKRREGTKVNCIVKEAGKYKNIRGIVGWDANDAAAPITESEKIEDPIIDEPVVKSDSDGARIGCMLNCATELVKGSGSGDFKERCEKSVDMVIMMERKIRDSL